jgi:phage N-6-adenine-methyltransferase
MTSSTKQRGNATVMSVAKIRVGKRLPVGLPPDANLHNEAYGKLKSELHHTGYSFERACSTLEDLLKGNGWKSCGPGFTEVNAFLDSIRLDEFRQRKRIASRIKALQPQASNRQIGKTLGVAGRTIDRDLATNVAPSGNKASKNNESGATNVAPVFCSRELLSQSNQNDWRTPRKFLDAAHTVMGGIDLDPASSEANRTVKAGKYYTEKDNGLEKPWKGRVWLNPPYGGDARLFIERLIREYEVGNVTEACCLLNSHPTETKWFQKLFDYTICFVAGRIDFGGPSREVSTTSTHGSAICYLGKNADRFTEVFEKFGAVLARKLVTRAKFREAAE